MENGEQRMMTPDVFASPKLVLIASKSNGAGCRIRLIFVVTVDGAEFARAGCRIPCAARVRVLIVMSFPV
jgi:hypothetical protein